jgi:hypothetical protein
VDADARGHRSGQSAFRDVEPDRVGVVILLEPEVQIELLAFDVLSNKPVPEYELAITSLSVDGKPRSQDQIKAQDGIYKFVLSEGSTYALELVAAGYETHRMRIEVTAETPRSLRIPLKPR